MKKFKSVLMLVAVILIAAGAAFATNAAKNSNGTTEPGYYIDNSTSRCLNSHKQCTTVIGDFCTWTDPNTGDNYTLREYDGTDCGDFLYEPVTP